MGTDEHGTGVTLATTDGGVTWRLRYSIPHALDLYGVAFADPTHGWVVGDNGIYATTDGGATWKVQYRDSQSLSLCGVAVAGTTHGWAVGNLADGNGNFEGSTILTTADGGMSWR